PRRLQGRHAAAQKHPGQRAAERRLAAAGAEEAAACRSALHRLRAAALSHLRADRVLPARDPGRWRQLLTPNPRHMPGFIKELMKYQVNSFPAVNTLYNGLLNSPGFDKVDFSKLKTSFGGGMATQKSVAEKWLAVTGCALSEGYGLSETSPTLTCNPPHPDKFSGLIGIPVPSTFISIRDDDGKEVPLGQPGEICAKGPQVMAGYWNRPEETANGMTAGASFPTG